MAKCSLIPPGFYAIESVYRDSAEPESMPYRAVSGRNQAVGRTAGEALDALASQLPREAADTFVIVRNMSPDRFFNAEQRSRLEELIALRREAIATKQGGRGCG
jgi:hypothetical protein